MSLVHLFVMSDRMCKYRSELHLLSTCSEKTKNILVRYLEKDFIAAICDAVWSTLSGAVPLSKKQKKDIKFHQDILRKICDASKTISQKRKLLQQPSASKAVREILMLVKNKF